jgi:hypothetical protein
LWIWWVSNGFPTSNKPPANRHAKNGHHSIKNDIWCCGQRILLCVIPFDLAATDRKGIDGSSAIELWIWWVSNRFPTSNKPPANRHAKNGHHSIKSDIWCCGQRILLCVIPFDLAATDGKGIDGSSAIELWIWWVLNRFEAEDGSAGWAFKQITGHMGPIASSHHDYKGPLCNVKVLWEDNSETHKPLVEMIKDDRASSAFYAKEKEFEENCQT